MPITLRVHTYRNEALPQPVVKRFDQLGGAIGRSVGNDLILEDPSKYISRVHAKIDFHDAGYYLTDVGSNPSLVNDRPLGRGRELLLADGDSLSIGEYHLSVNISPDTVPLPPSPLQVEPNIATTPAVLNASIDDSLSGAKILELAGSFDNPNFDPLGVNLFDTPVNASAQRPAIPAFRGAESDHISPEIQAFQMPVGAATTPVAPAGMAIPSDYDPLADYLPARSPVPKPATEASASAPIQIPADAFDPKPSPAKGEMHAAPTIESHLQSSPHPVFSPQIGTPDNGLSARTDQVAGSRGSVPVAAPLQQSSSASMPAASDNEVVLALLRGLGMPELKTNRSAVELAELVGAMLREATSGTMGVLVARTMTKRESRLEMTMIATQANNPLKFLPDPDSALTQMLANSMAGYMTPVRAFANAYDDLKAHELAILAGMRAALAGVLKRFDPTEIEQFLQVPTVMDNILAGNRKAKMWDKLVELYKEISNDADADFQRLFGEKFAAAYEEQIQRLRQSRK